MACASVPSVWPLSSGNSSIENSKSISVERAFGRNQNMEPAGNTQGEAGSKSISSQENRSLTRPRLVPHEIDGRTAGKHVG